MKKNNPLEKETGKYMTFVRQPTQVQRPGSSATNPSYQNYKPGYDFSGVKFPTTPTTPKIEQPKIEQPKTQQPQVSPYQPRINEEKQSFNSYNTLLNKTFDNRNKAIQSQMPYYEKGITNEQERAKQRLAEIDRRAALDQETTQTEADVATKNLAKTKQVQDVQRRNMFANLGTIESGGFMGFTGQQTNADEQFLTDSANITQQAQKIKDNIRAEAKIDRMTVEKIMEDTVAQFRNEIIKLKNAVVSNEDERQLQILNLQESLKARLYDIADQYETREAEREKAQRDLELEVFKITQNSENKASSNATKLRTEFMKQTKNNDFDKMRQHYNKITTTPDSAAGDLAMIFSFMKMLDPSSVVRESEQDLARNATSLPGQLQNYAMQVAKGQKLNPSQRADFRKVAQIYYDSETANLQNMMRYYNELATAQGLNPYEITGIYQGTNSAEPQSNNDDPLGLF